MCTYKRKSYIMECLYLGNENKLLPKMSFVRM